MKVIQRLLILLLLPFQMYCQDSMRKGQCQLKYGADDKEWPKWCNGFDSSNGMSLDTLDFEKIYLNSQKLYLAKDEPEINAEQVEGNRLIIGEILYLREDKGYGFNGLAFKLDYQNAMRLTSKNNLTLKISNLDGLREKLPNSFEWRDAIPSSVKAMIPEEEAINFTLVPVFDIASEQMIVLVYYKSDLTYLSL